MRLRQRLACGVARERSFEFYLLRGVYIICSTIPNALLSHYVEVCSLSTSPISADKCIAYGVEFGSTIVRLPELRTIEDAHCKDRIFALTQCGYLTCKSLVGILQSCFQASQQRQKSLTILQYVLTLEPCPSNTSSNLLRFGPLSHA